MPLIGDPPASWQLMVQPAELLPGELPDPAFGPSEAAKMFFGRSASWMRLQMSEVPSDSAETVRTRTREVRVYQTFSIGGHVFQLYRDPESHYRLFSLWDVEPLAWALFERDLAKAEAKYRRWVPNARRRLQLRQISATVFERKRAIYLDAIRDVERRLDIIRHLVWYEAALYGMQLPDEFPEYAGRLPDKQLIRQLEADPDTEPEEATS